MSELTTSPAAEATVPEPAAPKPVKKKIASLDLMKFMGILIVVYYHCRLVAGDTYIWSTAICCSITSWT